MDETESGRHRFRKWLIKSAWQTALCLLIYILSIGPMFWFWFESVYVDGPKWIQKLYWPLLMACELCDPLSRAVNWYINLWIY